MLKAVEPNAPHVLFMLWRMADNLTFGYIAIQHNVIAGKQAIYCGNMSTPN